MNTFDKYLQERCKNNPKLRKGFIKEYKKLVNEHIGEYFDDFLKSDGILEECTKNAIKKVNKYSIIMKKETEFRSKFVKLCNESGLYALALETTIPGFPDVQVMQNNKLLLIETKVITEKELTHKVITKFKSSQPVFYKDYLWKRFEENYNNDNLFCLIKVGKSKHFIVFRIMEELVNFMDEAHFNDLKSYTKNYLECYDLKTVIKWLRMFLK